MLFKIHKISVLLFDCSVSALAETAQFDKFIAPLFQACVVGRLVRLANVPFAGGLKLFLKMCVWKKIKNIGSAMSFGLLVVRLLYRFYVRVHLSKWFTFFLFLIVCLLLWCRLLGLNPIVDAKPREGIDTNWPASVSLLILFIVCDME